MKIDLLYVGKNSCKSGVYIEFNSVDRFRTILCTYSASRYWFYASTDMVQTFWA